MKVHFCTGAFGPKLQKITCSLRNVIKWSHRWCRWCTLAQAFFSDLVYSTQEEILSQHLWCRKCGHFKIGDFFWTPCMLSAVAFSKLQLRKQFRKLDFLFINEFSIDNSQLESNFEYSIDITGVWHLFSIRFEVLVSLCCLSKSICNFAFLPT